MTNPKKPTSKAKKKAPKKKGSYCKEPYPALNTRRQVFARREYMDGDYYHLLNDEEKAYMNAFLSETIVTNFNHGGPELYPNVEDKRAFYRANNARNRDVTSMAYAYSLMNNVDDIAKTLDKQEAPTADSVENTMIRMLELKNSGALEDALEPDED